MTDTTPSLTRDRFDAVLFDLDGVLTSTASVHAACWKRTFDAFLARWAHAGRAGQTRPFDIHEDYLRYVDGKPRYDGVRSFLASRAIELPEGTADDPPEAWTVCGLGNRKDTLMSEAIAAGRVKAYPESAAVLKRLRSSGFKTAVVSSSRHCKEVVTTSRLAAYFDTLVDGETVEKNHLAGKPAPDAFLRAAELLGVTAERSVVVEDASAGVEAGRSGHFGLVLGVDRGNQREELLHSGADRVIANLSEMFL